MNPLLSMLSLAVMRDIQKSGYATQSAPTPEQIAHSGLWICGAALLLPILCLAAVRLLAASDRITVQSSSPAMHQMDQEDSYFTTTTEPAAWPVINIRTETTHRGQALAHMSRELRASEFIKSKGW